MGFQNRWDFILDKAMKELKRDDVDLLSSWAECLAKAHRRFRLDQGPDETQRLAELDWWKHLFAQQPFPESGGEWQQDAPVIDLKDATSLIPVQSSPTQMAVNGLRGYTSCWEAMKLKALNAGTPLEDIMLDYRASIMEALKEWLRDYGQPYAMFRAELHMWRDLFPDEHFPGINLINGERNLTTGRDLQRCRSQTEEDRDESHQENLEANAGTQSTSHHQGSSQTVQARSPDDGSQRSESMDIEEQSLDGGVKQSRGISKTGPTREEQKYRLEGRGRSRSRSPEGFAQRPDIRQRSPLRDPTNPPARAIPFGPRAMTTRGSPFSFRGGAFMRGGFQNNRGGFNLRGGAQAMRGGHYDNTDVAYTGGRVVTPLGPSCFPNLRDAAPVADGMPSNASPTAGATPNATGTPEDLLHSHLPSKTKQ